MRICVVVPSQEYMAQAGVRIRYKRVDEFLRKVGCELVTEQIDEFRKDAKPRDDVYIFSKCYDARALVLAKVLSAAGKPLGVDVFDDYFSQVNDVRLAHLRAWFGAIGEQLDFTLCSTPRMKEVLAGVLPGLPCHIMNDPFDAFDAEALARSVEGRVAEARRSRVLKVLWFGMGDNPYFPVGLADLVATGGVLRHFGREGFTPRLTVSTNRRALTVQNLEMLRRLPVPFEVQEWSEQSEAELLASHLVAFLPVNAQPFSIAKSLNRCVSALSAGAQVLTAGYPLYEPFDDLIYRDPMRLIGDVAAGTTRVRRDTMGLLGDRLAAIASPMNEAHGLAEFMLRQLIRKRSGSEAAAGTSSSLALVHGKQSVGATHKLAQKLGGLSVASAFSLPNLNYDVYLDVAPAADALLLSVTARALPLLRADLQQLATDGVSANGKAMKIVALPAGDAASIADWRVLRRNQPLSEMLVNYGASMEGLETLLARVFPGISVLVSEQSALCANLLTPHGKPSAAAAA